ncbi:MAG TPA: NIPSNAP family containing protein [Candidatus Limnocylindria bacterium]|nr:NIPSNAP family containing protein [Candidatus Limnocylindria bacterium]
MTIELRDYAIAAGHLDQFVEEWRQQVVPIRRAHGYRIEAAWKVPAEDRFVWLLSLGVPASEWEARNDVYYADPARLAVDPDPARLVEAQRRVLVEAVDPQG